MVIFTVFFLLLLLLIGMPIAFVLIFVGSFGVYTIGGYDKLHGIISVAAYSSVNDFTFSALPLFILMAHFIAKSEIADDLFDTTLKWIGHIPGGAGIATVFASAGFGALSGSSTAGTAVMSQIAVPKMIKSKYSDSFSAGLVASSSGTLAALIPPSILLILYGIQTETPIGKLLMAGILPGVLLAVLLCLTVIFVGIKQKTQTEKYSWNERLTSLKYIWPTLVLIVSIIVFIFAGIGTPTEAAAFGALGAFLIGIVMRRLNTKKIIDSLMITIKQTGMIFLIIVGAQIFTYYLTMSRVGHQLIELISSSGYSAYTVLVLVILLYLVLGMFMESIGLLLLTLPLVFPLIISVGFDPIWFGVVVVILLEIGLITPPVGMNLFITSQHSGVPVSRVLKGTIPFIIVLMFTLLLLIIFPEIVTYLPSMML